MKDWQDIETAPKDGTWVLLYGDRYGEPRVVAAFWSADGDWFDSEAASTPVTAFEWNPTQWVPLAPPKPNNL